MQHEIKLMNKSKLCKKFVLEAKANVEGKSYCKNSCTPVALSPPPSSTKRTYDFPANQQPRLLHKHNK